MVHYHCPELFDPSQDFKFIGIAKEDVLIFGEMDVNHSDLTYAFTSAGGVLPPDDPIDYYDLQANGYYFVDGLPTTNDHRPSVLMPSNFFGHPDDLFAFFTMIKGPVGDAKIKHLVRRCMTEQNANIRFALEEMVDGVKSHAGEVQLPLETPLYFEIDRLGRNTEVIRKQMGSIGLFLDS